MCELSCVRGCFGVKIEILPFLALAAAAALIEPYKLKLATEKSSAISVVKVNDERIAVFFRGHGHG
jgi:hypothetical protein